MRCGGFSSSVITNTIFWGDEASRAPGIWVSYLDSLTIRYSDVQGRQDSMYVEGLQIWGDGMIRSNPHFFDPSGGDYRLSSESPCVDAGTDAGVTGDFEGDPRPQGYGFDIGADESPYSVAYNLTLTPNGPLSVPRGDDVSFHYLIQNNTDFSVSGDFWLSVLLPNCNEIVVPENVLDLPNPQTGELPANSLYNPNVLLSVPMMVDTGSYTLIGRIGNFPGTIFDEDSFDIEVTE